jgi:enoyl-CoA hydratase/carnithine racemase
MAVSGIAVDATDAVRLGLVDVVTDEPEAALARCLRRLARLDRRSIAAVKRLASVYRAEHREFEAAALHTFMQLLDSPETQARLRRFAMGFGPWPDDSSA